MSDEEDEKEDLLASIADSLYRLANSIEIIEQTLSGVVGRMDDAYGGHEFIRTSDIGD